MSVRHGLLMVSALEKAGWCSFKNHMIPYQNHSKQYWLVWKPPNVITLHDCSQKLPQAGTNFLGNTNFSMNIYIGLVCYIVLFHVLTPHQFVMSSAFGDWFGADIRLHSPVWKYVFPYCHKNPASVEFYFFWKTFLVKNIINFTCGIALSCFNQQGYNMLVIKCWEDVLYTLSHYFLPAFP